MGSLLRIYTHTQTYCVYTKKSVYIWVWEYVIGKDVGERGEGGNKVDREERVRERSGASHAKLEAAGLIIWPKLQPVWLWQVYMQGC